MAAQATAIANIFEPEIWSRYLLEQTTDKSLLVQSGIVGTDAAIAAAASQGGRTVTMPFWDDLAHDTGATTRSKVATDTDDKIVPAGLTSDEDIAVKHFRTQAFQTSPIIDYVDGEDAAQVIISRYAKWWQREEQRLLLKSLTGIFSVAGIAAALQNDISGEVATTDASKLVSSDAILDTRFLLGDNFDKLTGLITHSTVFKRMCKLDLIDNLKESQQDPTVMPKYMGLNVLVDDGMTVVAGGTSGYKYHTYLFGQGAFARQDVPMKAGEPNMVLVKDDKAGTGAGMLDIITRRYFLLHPRGIKYKGSLAGKVSPSDTDLATAANWEQVYQTKNIRIARLVTNG